MLGTLNWTVCSVVKLPSTARYKHGGIQVLLTVRSRSLWMVTLAWLATMINTVVSIFTVVKMLSYCRSQFHLGHMNYVGRYGARINTQLYIPIVTRTIITWQRHYVLLGSVTTIEAIWPWLHSTWRRSFLALLKKVLFLSVKFIRQRRWIYEVLPYHWKQEIEETMLMFGRKTVYGFAVQGCWYFTSSCCSDSWVAGHLHMHAAQEIKCDVPNQKSMSNTF